MTMEMIERPCPLCESRVTTHVYAEANFDSTQLDGYAYASRKLPEYMHHRLIFCSTCDMVYSSPIPSQEGLESAYQDAAYDSGLEASLAACTYGRLLARFADSLPDRQGALDIGAGDGAFLEYLVEAGFTDVVGVEPSAAPIAAAKPNIRPLIRQGMFHANDFEPGRFSIVTCFQTIEHLMDPLTVCREAHRLLKPGGALFVIGHNRRAMSAKLLGRKSPIFDLEHLQLFSFQSAKHLLRRAGFNEVSVRPFFNRYPLHYWTKLFPLPRKLKRPLLRALEQRAIGRITVSLPAGNMAVVGFKRE